MKFNINITSLYVIISHGVKYMLTRFNVGNFLSFNEIQEFSMLKGKPISKNHHIYNSNNLKILKFASIFGANAAGKSNFVKSLSVSRNLILNGLDSQYDLQKYYFRLDETSKSKPSYFEFEFLLNEEVYSYGFELILAERKIISEWLLKLKPNGKNINIFTRSLDNTFEKEKTITSSLKIEDKNLRNKFSVYKDDIRKNTNLLFLNEMNRNKNQLYREKNELKVFEEVYNWFRFTLSINHPDMPISDLTYFRNTENKEAICRIINSFDTGITNFKEEEVDFNEVIKDAPQYIVDDLRNTIGQLQKESKHSKNLSVIVRLQKSHFTITADKEGSVKIKTLKFYHDEKSSTLFDFGEESDGTRRIFDLIEILLTNKNKVFVIDELDRSLHPKLIYHFIKHYLDEVSRQNVQLIITTHEVRLLDFNLLRQDEIWLMDKSKNGSTSIYSLDEYNVRFDKKVDKAYLEGRYGGVPNFSD